MGREGGIHTRKLKQGRRRGDHHKQSRSLKRSFCCHYSPFLPLLRVCVCVWDTMEVVATEGEKRGGSSALSPSSAKLPASLLYNDHWTATTTYLATLSLFPLHREMERLERGTRALFSSQAGERAPSIGGDLSTQILMESWVVINPQ